MSFYQDYLKKKNEEKKEFIDVLKEERNENSNNSLKTPKKEEEKETEKSLSKEELERKKFLEKVYGKDEKQEEKPRTEAPSPEQEKKEIISTPPAPPKIQKTLTRILFTFLVIAGVGVITALVWYWAIKTPRIVTETVTREVETIIEIPEIEAPLSFLSYDKFLDGVVTNIDEIPVYLKQFVEDEYESDDIIKVLIKNQTDRRNPEFLKLRTLFNSLGIRSPSGFYDRIEDRNLNVFVYSANGKNELGIIFPVVEGGGTELLGIILATWIDTFERDLINFYSLTEPKEETIPTTTIHQRTNIRCNNFSSGHHLCYTPYERVFIITTSLESARAAIDNFK